jgi:hypothetical protein
MLTRILWRFQIGFMRLSCVALLGFAHCCAQAVMAGLAPDSPAARVDANRVDSLWTGVGAVLVDAASYFGVAIGPRHVLTAAHVVGNADPARIRVQFNSSSTPLVMRVDKVLIHPGFSGFGIPNLNDDLAVIVLSAPLPPEVHWYPIYRTAPRIGLDFRLVGYGGSGLGNGEGRLAADPAVKRVGGNSADRYLADDDGSGLLEIYLFDFDGEGAVNVMGDVGLGNSIETSLAQGDSGSPSFITGPGQPQLFGINTFLSRATSAEPGTLGTVGGGMVVSSYAAWIDAVMEASPIETELRSEEVPVPLWALAIHVGALAWLARRYKRSV